MKQFFERLKFPADDIKPLEIPDAMFAPETPGVTPGLILEQVKNRTTMIRRDLADFLDGKLMIFH